MRLLPEDRLVLSSRRYVAVQVRSTPTLVVAGASGWGVVRRRPKLLLLFEIFFDQRGCECLDECGTGGRRQRRHVGMSTGNAPVDTCSCSPPVVVRPKETQNPSSLPSTR